MIDIEAPADLFPVGADRQLAEELTSALLLDAHIHRLDPKAVNTAGTRAARTVRVQVLTPPGTLNRAGQQTLVAEVTQIVTKIAPASQRKAHLGIAHEAAEGGWGIAGTAFGREEFAALAAKPSAIASKGSP
jgi:hypothetical protein